MRALPVWVNGIFLCQPSENKIGPSWSALMSRWWRHAFDNKHLVRLMRLVIKGASHPWPVGGVLQPCLQGAFNQPWHMNEEELCSLAHPGPAALPVSCIRCSLSQEAWHMPTLPRLQLSFASNSGLCYCTSSQSIWDLNSFIFTCCRHIIYGWLPP